MDYGRLLLLPLLLCCSAFFSASETALFSLRHRDRKRLAEQGDPLSQLLRSLIARPRSVLVSTLLGNLVINVFYFSVVHSVVTESKLGGAAAFAAGLGALLAVLIVGEILPKLIALRRPLLVAKLGCGPLWTVDRVLTPLCWLLEALLAAFHRLLGVTPSEKTAVRGEDLRGVVEAAVSQGALASSEGTQLIGVLAMRRLRVRELMTPRVDLFSVSRDAELETLRESIREKRPGWLLVHGESVDEIHGYLKADRLLIEGELTLRGELSPPLFIPESATVLDHVRQCRAKGAPLAVIVDEFGGTAGLLTVERVLEEIVGGLPDEHEEEHEDFHAVGEGRWVVPGNLPIHTWNHRTGAELPATRFETLAGLVSDQLGAVPSRGDYVRFQDLGLKVLRVRDGRVLHLEITLVRRVDREDAGGLGDA